nr:MAG TPA: hypothetical protein [Caudoviricetes sp.]
MHSAKPASCPRADLEVGRFWLTWMFVCDGARAFF